MNYLNNNIQLILCCQGIAHICKIDAVTNEKPDIGLPGYYDTFLFGRNINPEVYTLGPNECKYAKEGICSCKSSVNYQYLCEKTSRCIKQKR